MDFVGKLDGCSGFECIFGLVKDAVKATTGRWRVGLILGLKDMPNHIGALHQVGSNFIIMNKRLLEGVIKSGDKNLINAYIFHILLHEYIHSLGFVNEQETQIMTHTVSEQFFGTDHPVTRIARYGIGSVFSNMPKDNLRKADSKGRIEIVKDIESENLNYFG